MSAVDPLSIEERLRRLVADVERSKAHGDFDGMAMAEIDAEELGVPFRKVLQIVSQRARIPKLKADNAVPLYVVALIEKGLYQTGGQPHD